MRHLRRDVAIEIDYHPDHADNVDRMIAAVKKSLDYFTIRCSAFARLYEESQRKETDDCSQRVSHAHRSGFAK